MRTITGTVKDVRRYLAGQFSERVDYSVKNSSRCALITISTNDDQITVDMQMREGVSPNIGDSICVELDNDGSFGFLYPEDVQSGKNLGD